MFCYKETTDMISRISNSFFVEKEQLLHWAKQCGEKIQWKPTKIWEKVWEKQTKTPTTTTTTKTKLYCMDIYNCDCDINPLTKLLLK